MAEPTTPAVFPYSNQFHGRIFSRSRLRDQMGPSVPSYHLLETLCIRDVVLLRDDFYGVLNTDIWTASNNGAGVSNFARLANTLDGVIQGDAGTDDDGDVRLFTTSNAIWQGGNRCGAIARVRMPSAVADSKFEFGFADAAGAGAVLVKDTPTSTATDYAVIIRDVDDDTSVDLVADGTTDAIELVASSPGITFATNTYYTLMLAVDENRSVAFWIDGVYQGRSVSGPDATTALGLWFYVQNRADSNNRQLDIDYVQAWQERVAI